MKKDRRKRILISVPMLTYQHRQGIEGILRYVHENKASSWETYLETELLDTSMQLNLKRWGCDGIIAYIARDKMRERLLAANVPAVFFDSLLSEKEMQTQPRRNVTFITHDFKEEGRIAARYFIERHYRHFAYVGLDGKTIRTDIDRQTGFTEELAKNGFNCIVYPRSSDARSGPHSNGRIDLSSWLRNLPRPTGLFVVRDMRALDVVAAASYSSVHIPEHVAIIGFDNDELICETCSPPLSSISADISSLGHEGALQLDRLMAGHKSEVIVRLPKLQPMTRYSTAIDAVGDPFVSQALSWIRKNLTEDFSVDTAAKGIGYPKNLLQKRFKKVLGCTIGSEIRRIRLEWAMHLIRTSNKSISQIADTYRFSNASYLCRRIREKTGRTPKTLFKPSGGCTPSA